MAFRTLCLIALLGLAAASDVTPIEKVISLVDDLKKEVEADGKAEAKTYEAFACFCNNENGKKSSSITRENDNIKMLSAEIADKTASKEEKETETAERKAKGEKLAADLSATEVALAKAKAEFEVTDADLSTAIQGLDDAKKALESTKSAAAFLQAHASVKKTLEMAMLMGTISASKKNMVTAFLQKSSVDPSDPDYKYHSQGIIDIIADLHKDYSDNLKEITDEWLKTKKAKEEMISTLEGEIKNNNFALDTLSKAIDGLKKRIAEARTELIESKSTMEDDELYLTDLTKRCEARANDWDQRSAQRNDEITALKTALEILQDSVKGAADDVNVRAAFIQDKPAAKEATKPAAEKKVEANTTKVAVKADAKAAPSFLQEVSKHFLARAGLSHEDRKQNALRILKDQAKKSHSMVLASLVEKVQSDPFKKVKGLIQKLIERLLAESQAEASKKGFCDTELAKAEHDRDYRFTDAKDLNTELVALEAKEDALEAEIEELTEDIKNEKAALKMATEDRTDEKEDNMETLKTAKEGLTAVTEALAVLKKFYKQAAKASFVQESASPLDEDTAGAGFSGNYKGKQAGSKAIFALLETIASDFDRTIRKTTEAESAAHRAYVDYSQHAESSISSKSTKKTLDEEDLKTTKDTIASKMADLQTAMDLLDKALNELEDLKPVCIDTGMSYAERVAKREEEMAALQKALCQLDEENVEPTC